MRRHDSPQSLRISRLFALASAIGCAIVGVVVIAVLIVLAVACSYLPQHQEGT
jgi:hypothetical protein